MRRIFCRIINYAFYSPKGSFWEKLVFEICASHSRISSDNKCGFFAQNFPVGLSNLNPKCVQIILFKKNFCWNFYQFLYFWTVSSNFSDFWQKNNDWVAESALYSFRDFQRRKTLSPENVFPSSFWLWANDFRASGQKVRKVNQNCTLCVQRRLSKETIFKLKSFFSNSLSTCADDFQDSGEKCRKYHQRFIPLVQTNILTKKSFGENEFNTCGVSVNKSQNFVRKVWRRNFWGNKFCKKGNSNHFLTLGKKVSNFSPKIARRAVITALYVSKGQILWKKNLEVYSSLFFSDTAQNFLDFMRRVFCRFIKYAFYSPKGSFWEKFLFEICAWH